MLNAYLYRVRKSLLKSPLKIVLGILLIALCVLMILVPTWDDGEDVVVVANQVKLGVVNIIMIAEFCFMYFTGLISGIATFSFADVNFHLAGPFTKKFNLLIAAAGSFQVAGLFLFVLCCQSAVVYMATGIRGLGFVAFLLVSFFIMLVGYILGSLIGTITVTDEKKKNVVTYVSYAIVAILAGGALLEVVNTHGAISKIRENGTLALLGELGTSKWLQIFPGAGWFNMIYSGLVLDDKIFLLVGSILSLGLIALIVMVFVKVDFDYYEVAIENAQKIADVKEARRAGVDSDTTKMNSKIKVGKETLTKGWGASAFTHRFFLENSRASRLFFANKLTVLYRVICFFYMIFMTKMNSGEPVDEAKLSAMISGLTMMIMLDLPLYAGGKTILEFNRPYIFLIPESASKKLAACLAGGIPEMVFDAILCTAIFAFNVSTKPFVLVAVFLLMLTFAFLCQLSALICLRIFKSLGKYMLMVVRYFVVIAFLLVALIPGVVIGSILNSITLGLLLASGFAVVISVVILIISRNIIDKVEYGS